MYLCTKFMLKCQECSVGGRLLFYHLTTGVV